MEKLQSQKIQLEAEKGELEKTVSQNSRDLATKNEEIENLRDLLRDIGDDSICDDSICMSMGPKDFLLLKMIFPCSSFTSS